MYYLQDREANSLKTEHVEALLEEWSKFDPLATGRIPVMRSLSDLAAENDILGTYCPFLTTVR